MPDADPTTPSPSGVWRFAKFLPPVDSATVVSYPEGNTPLLRRAALSTWASIDDLTIKHEGLNPTGSFKDRGMTVAITRARQLGVPAVACASTGNTSASLAAYAAHAGIPALAMVPTGRVTPGKLAQTLAYGATTVLVDGDFDACLRLIRDAERELGIYLANSINPFRIEGQKTIALELLHQRGWTPPDWIVLPAGNLGNTAAIGKAVMEAFEWNLIARPPRIAAVQATGAAPFAQAYARDFAALEPVQAETIASAIRIGAPASYHRAVRAIRDTRGVVVAVSDDEILDAKTAIDRAGVGCEPASAAALAGARQLRAAGTIGPGESVVVILTGHLLKDTSILERIHRSRSAMPRLANRPKRIPATVDAVRRVLRAASRG